jgi:hypothetical protein
MISSRGVAKKRRAQQLAGMTVKCSLTVAGEQQSWRGGNHLAIRLALLWQILAIDCRNWIPESDFQ